MSVKPEMALRPPEVNMINKMSIAIWERKFELDVIYKTFAGKGITALQGEAADMFYKKKEFNDSLEQIKMYVMSNGGLENGVTGIDNIFRYVMPKCIYIPKANNRTVAILCDYRFDPEHGIAVVYENDIFTRIDEEGVII